MLLKFDSPLLYLSNIVNKDQAPKIKHSQSQSTAGRNYPEKKKTKKQDGKILNVGQNEKEIFWKG